MQDHARALGFWQVILIDEHLGISGSGSRERPGFGGLLTAVCEGRAGAGSPRLARKNRDWHHLIDLCVLTDTLVIDADGVYDPRQLNDRCLSFGGLRADQAVVAALLEAVQPSGVEAAVRAWERFCGEGGKRVANLTITHKSDRPNRNTS